ncbi:MAG: tRNA (N(6)-L-threonylcarbamoyladenosine(37)-C(2))-methylthiotransferase [Nitrososphaerales archaeon]
MDKLSRKQTQVYVEGHGCSASLADTEIITGIIGHEGFAITDTPSKADVSVLVTCSVKSITEARMIERIKDLSHDGRKLIVAGCLPKADPKKILSISPSLSMIGPGDVDKIVPAVESTLENHHFVSLSSSKLVKVGLPRSRRNQTIGIVEIASGCLSACTFCQVKLVKGTVFSYPEKDIIDEVKSMVSSGVREIWLTSTDNAAYGRDSRSSLSDLVRKIANLDGDFMIRVGMMNPLLTDSQRDELIEIFNHDKVFKFLHLPVQSGSNRILKLMRRGYDVEDYLQTVRTFRESVKDLTLSTDIIVGFPSETEEDFQDSLQLIKDSQPDVLNLSRFGAREGTSAAVMPNQVTPAVSKQRSRVMSQYWRSVSLARNRKWISWRGTALVDETVRGAVIARNPSYKPCVIKSDSSKVSVGEKVTVKIFGATPFTLRAELSN